MKSDDRFDLGYLAFQAALAIAISTRPEIYHIGSIMICLSFSIPSTFALWIYRSPRRKNRLRLRRIATFGAYLGGFFAFALLIGSFSYIGSLIFLSVSLFWMISLKLPPGDKIVEEDKAVRYPHKQTAREPNKSEMPTP